MKTAYGISRSRDRKGVIVNQNLCDYTMCVHTMVGGGWDTMQVLVLEVYESDECGTEG